MTYSKYGGETDSIYATFYKGDPHRRKTQKKRLVETYLGFKFFRSSLKIEGLRSKRVIFEISKKFVRHVKSATPVFTERFSIFLQFWIALVERTDRSLTPFFVG